MIDASTAEVIVFSGLSRAL